MGGTPIIWKSEWQGAVQTSTYSTEISSICLAVEEANTIRYMLRSLRIKVSKPSNTIGDNEATIICQTPLKKKHIALSYHFVRENTATKTKEAYSIILSFCEGKHSNKDHKHLSDKW